MTFDHRPARIASLRWLGAMFVALELVASGSAEELPAEVLKNLASPEFKVRETAQADLLTWARNHEQKSPRLLFEHHRATTDPEVKFRCMEVLEELARDGYAQHGKGFIGIQMRDELVQVPGKDQPQAAIRVTFVLPGMAAEKAGIKVGELLLGINGKTWPSPATDNMRQQVMDMKPTTKITLQMLRNGKVEDVEVTLDKRPVAADVPMFDQMPDRAAEAEKQLWEEYFEEWKQSHDAG